jgi:hypothetical protein
MENDMRTTHRSTLVVLIAVLALATPAALRAASSPSSAPAPTITGLLSPADGAVIAASSLPTFGWSATPGGRFRVQFSSSRSPFITTIDSGRRTTPGDQFKPSAKQWRMILNLAAGTNTVYWRAIALHMSPDQIAAVPISSFTVQR